jgi:hypothetical protein
VFKNPENAEIGRKISFQAKRYLFSPNEMFKNSGSDHPILCIIHDDEALHYYSSFKYPAIEDSY